MLILANKIARLVFPNIWLLASSINSLVIGMIPHLFGHSIRFLPDKVYSIYLYYPTHLAKLSIRQGKACPGRSSFVQSELDPRHSNAKQTPIASIRAMD